ncbi:TMEM175 family protein [Pediococcus acidilactici]|uniref:TMEM175 family protein n=1 Tax=Pediococcus acidilactici TaxID=1254 RepID=UPI002009E3B1|nr:TMEM175 family protein [Pediococcus acidilactici]UPU33831.1 TMEM175 family protein [Pediococcus acidilactici]
MSKERLTAFEDAILAIIMTILVLELRKPSEITLQGFWSLHANFFAYTLSFFWIGTMWVSHHNNWQHVQKINLNTVMLTLVLLFLASLFPYTTSIVSDHFSNVTAQVFYGIIIILISLLNVVISVNLGKLNPKAHFGLLYTIPTRIVYLDLLFKVLGLILAVTIYPPAMMISIFCASSLLLLSFNRA